MPETPPDSPSQPATEDEARRARSHRFWILVLTLALAGAPLLAAIWLIFD